MFQVENYIITPYSVIVECYSAESCHAFLHCTMLGVASELREEKCILRSLHCNIVSVRREKRNNFILHIVFYLGNEKDETNWNGGIHKY
jgi:hypothetical protein